MKKRRIIAAIIAATLALSCITLLSGCASAPYIMTIDGEQIRPGIFIVNQYTALGEARQKLSAELNADFDADLEEDEDNVFIDINDADFDYDAHYIDDVPFYEWVNERAMETTARMLVVDQIFKERGLAFPPEYLSEMNAGINAMWEQDLNFQQFQSMVGQFGEAAFSLLANKSWGEFFTEAGVSLESYRFVLQSEDKEGMVFESFYGEEGTETVTDQEWKSFYEENYVRFRRLEFPIRSTETDDDEDNARNEKINAENETFLRELAEYFNSPPPNVVVSFADLSERQQAFTRMCEDCDEFMRHCTCFEPEPECPDDCDCEDCNPTCDCDPEEDEDCIICYDCEECGDCVMCIADSDNDFSDIADDIAEMLDLNFDSYERVPDEPEGEGGEVLTFIGDMDYGKAVFYESENRYWLFVRLDIWGNDDTNLRREQRIEAVADMKQDGFSDMIEDLANDFLNRSDVEINQEVLAKHDPRWFIESQRNPR
jgi:hypothetical protein